MKREFKCLESTGGSEWVTLRNHENRKYNPFSKWMRDFVQAMGPGTIAYAQYLEPCMFMHNGYFTR